MAANLREHIVAYFEEHHKVVEAGAVDLLLRHRQPLIVSHQLVERAGPTRPFVTLEMVESVFAEAEEVPVATAGLRPSAGRVVLPAPDAAGFQPIHEGYSGPVGGESPLVAYSALFRSRHQALARMLRGRPELENLRPIREIRPEETTTSVIGMVRDVRETVQRHHLVLTVEDETGAIELLVPKDSPGAKTTFLSDEVVGLRLRFARDPRRLPRVEAVERPEVPRQRLLGRARRPARALFLSDLHIGSKSFLAEEWGHLIDFLHGRGPLGDRAAEVRYVVVAGDLVDGIGIYPRQERDLRIADIVEQYAELGRRLAELPSSVTAVVVPGNHDAVCPAEPQPSLPTGLARVLPDNVRTLGNPSTFSLDGVVVSAYHGRSFDDLIPALPGASYSRPTEVMRRMLQMRHLAPIYGDRTPLAPAAHDGLVLETAPDLFVTGHSHTYGVERYRGVLLLNVSTWQGETEYQRMRNIVPVPAHAALVDLASLGVETLDFSGGDPTVTEAGG